MLEHGAAVYRTDAEFLDSVVPFIAAGEERGEPTLVVTTEPNINALRDALPPEDGVVTFVERSRWAAEPREAVQRCKAFLEHSVTGGASWTRILAEPAWRRADRPEVHMWGEYEALVNFAFSAAPVRVLCPYDARTVPGAVWRQAEVLHSHTAPGEAGGESSP
jgi:MEDS: MEthanogen/methylotroph, DcmR Sensory domain